jgi:chorismate mutase
VAEERDVSTRAEGDRQRAAGELSSWRTRIDVIDGQLMRLLNSRSACAVEIGRVKRRLGLAVYSPEREAAILERVACENPGPLDATAVRRVFERIIDESRRLERLAAEGAEPSQPPTGSKPPTGGKPPTTGGKQSATDKD